MVNGSNILNNSSIKKFLSNGSTLRWISRFAIIFVLILLFVFFSITAPNFLAFSNFINLLRQVSISGILAIGMTCVMLTGGIDLSVGAILGISSVLTAIQMVNGINPIIASLVSLTVGTLLGLINSLLVSRIKIPPMIATIGTMTSLRGLAYLMTGGIPVFGFNPQFSKIGQGYLWGVPIPVYIMAVSYIIGIIFLSKTRFSRHIYGVGGNEEVARLSGINVNKVKAVVYGISGFCSALAGLVMLGRINSGQPRSGDGYEMDVITAVVMGGVSLTGGVGNLSFVIVGVMIIGILSNGMTMLAIDDYTQRVVKGLVLLLAVGFDRFIQKRRMEKDA